MSAHFINIGLYYIHRTAITIKNYALCESATCLLCSPEILYLLQFTYYIFLNGNQVSAILALCTVQNTYMPLIFENK